MTRNTCQTCRFFEDMNDGDPEMPGCCHRYPMSLRPVDDTWVHDFVDAFPDQWCGEWQEAQP